MIVFHVSNFSGLLNVLLKSGFYRNEMSEMAVQCLVKFFWGNASPSLTRSVLEQRKGRRWQTGEHKQQASGTRGLGLRVLLLPSLLLPSYSITLLDYIIQEWITFYAQFRQISFEHFLIPCFKSPLFFHICPNFSFKFALFLTIFTFLEL